MKNILVNRNFYDLSETFLTHYRIDLCTTSVDTDAPESETVVNFQNRL